MSRASKKIHAGQTWIPTEPSPNAKAELTDEDRAAEYARQVGADAAARQAQAYADAHRCTCGKGDKEPVARHSPGCHKIPLRFGR